MGSNRISLTLTKEQRDQVKHAIGRNAEAIELSVEELEERIAPTRPHIKDNLLHY